MKKHLSTFVLLLALALLTGTAAIAKPTSTRPHGTRAILSKIDKDLTKLAVLAACGTSENCITPDDECEGANCVLTMPKLLSRISERTNIVINRIERSMASGRAHRLRNTFQIQNLLHRISSDMQKMAALQACETSNCVIGDKDECDTSNCMIARSDLIKRIAIRQALLHSLLAQ